MKRVLVIGASGSLAKYVIAELKKRSDTKLTLFLRNKGSLRDTEAKDCEVIEGDVMDYTRLKAAIEEQDIVYVNLAGDLEAMAKNIVKAMKEAGVKRIIAISSIGIFVTPLKPVLIPYRKLSDVIESSGLDYTILRPDWFTDSREIDYEITRKTEPEKGTAISKKSIAAFISKIVEAPEHYIGENLGIAKPVA